MARITIIKDDDFVRADNQAVVWSTSLGLDNNIHAVQWFDSYGWIEYKVGPSESITSLPTAVQEYVDDFTDEYNNSDNKITIE